jgi:hypothetical protein
LQVLKKTAATIHRNFDFKILSKACVVWGGHLLLLARPIFLVITDTCKMAQTITKRLFPNGYPIAVERTQSSVQVHPMRSSDALLAESARWFGQPLSHVWPNSDRKVHPQTTPPEVAGKVIDAALGNPVWGCCRLAEELKQHNILISSPTVQKILIKQRMGSQLERATRVLELAEQGQRLTLQQSLQVKRIMRTKN